MTEQTTDTEKTGNPHEKTVRFLNPIHQTSVKYKIYIKGLSSKNGTRYGVSVRRLQSSNKHRQSWSRAMHKSDKELTVTEKKVQSKSMCYYQYPDEVKGHYSHALPNCMHGLETASNAAWATQAKFSSRFVGQGDAQGYIEQALMQMHDNKNKIDNEIQEHNIKSPDLRWKSSDAFSEDGKLIYRRIKIYVSDTYAATKETEKSEYHYPEVMLGEFFLPGELAVSKNSSFVHELKSKISQMQSHYDDMLSIFENNYAIARDGDFWQNNGFASRDIEFKGVKKDRSHPRLSYDALSKEDKALFEQSEPVAFQQHLASISLSHKINKNDMALAPRIIPMANNIIELDKIIASVEDRLKKQHVVDSHLKCNALDNTSRGVLKPRHLRGVLFILCCNQRMS